ncbi:DUF4328 domain-containing protein [Streptomyces sp. NA04227]|uniref:DUF4328 domain-containing protein n=1 Tax=Streptomyces sp. NA04227 TaxID=2742136 RepID=UPI0015918912|nr:DUF4328 domain-containing protein [Streptomyces sp. NA04227]QKW09720.1 DUF4328 domain-containing protein [Streptomyces sp. NA04227]
MSDLPVAPPPPSGPYFQPVPSTALRSPVGLSQAVSVLLAVVIATDLFAVWAGWQSLDVVNRLDSPGFASVTDEEVDRADTWHEMAGVAQVVALLATAVMFLVWFFRMRVNAEVLAPEYHVKKRGWTIGGWFCPVLNLWYPRRIALDIWHASSDENHHGAALLNWWWALWLIASSAGWTASRQYARAESADEVQNALGSVLFTDTLNIVAAIVALLFVRRLTHMQHQKALRGPVLAPFAPQPPAV